MSNVVAAHASKGESLRPRRDRQKRAVESRGLLGRQAVDLDGGCHVGINASAPEKKTATERGGRQVGGGGGTAGPPLSGRAGLCLHPGTRMRSVLSGRN